MLEDLDFADDNCATCHPGIATCMKRLGIGRGSSQVGLKFIAKKCKTLRTEFALSRESIMDNGEEV